MHHRHRLAAVWLCALATWAAVPADAPVAEAAMRGDTEGVRALIEGERTSTRPSGTG